MKFKKILIGLLVIINVFCFFIIPTSKKTNMVSADTAVSTGYENYAQSYFRHLTNNYPVNHYGSCGYVAMSMLLSYYDTFYDDNIIPEQYDVSSENAANETTLSKYNMVNRNNSPGVLEDTFTVSNYHTYVNSDGNTVLSKYGLGQWINSAKETSLQAKLLSLGVEMNYINVSSQTEEAHCSSTNPQRKDLFDLYFQNVLNMSSSEYEIHREYDEISRLLSDYHRNKVISYIRQGIPVLVSVEKANESRHAVVAYDYDEESDKIYAHMGWKGTSKTHTVIEDEGYIYYRGYLSLAFNTPHNCSNNYVVQTKDTNGNVISEKTYCYEHKDIITYDHVCSYGEWVATDSKHTKTCHCTEKVESAHTYDSNNTCTVCEHHTHDYHYSYVSRTQCKGVCEYCNYQIITTHDINLLTKVCRQCFARFSNDGVEVPINNLPPDIVCTKNHQHNSSCVIVARE